MALLDLQGMGIPETLSDKLGLHSSHCSGHGRSSLSLLLC
ncbi:MAG: SapB/AmfS family lanthipeptide [Pseudonocardiaceae bacterium]